MQIDPDDTLQVEMVPLERRGPVVTRDGGKWRYMVTYNGEPTGRTEA